MSKTYNFTIRATDSSGAWADRAFSATVSNTDWDRFIVCGGAYYWRSKTGLTWLKEIRAEAFHSVFFKNDRWFALTEVGGVRKISQSFDGILWADCPINALFPNIYWLYTVCYDSSISAWVFGFTTYDGVNPEEGRLVITNQAMTSYANLVAPKPMRGASLGYEVYCRPGNILVNDCQPTSSLARDTLFRLSHNFSPSLAGGVTNIAYPYNGPAYLSYMIPLDSAVLLRGGVAATANNGNFTSYIQHWMNIEGNTIGGRAPDTNYYGGKLSYSNGYLLTRNSIPLRQNDPPVTYTLPNAWIYSSDLGLSWSASYSGSPQQLNNPPPFINPYVLIRSYGNVHVALGASYYGNVLVGIGTPVTSEVILPNSGVTAGMYAARNPWQSAVRYGE